MTTNIARNAHNIGSAGRWLLLLAIPLILTSCNTKAKRENRALLAEAAFAMEDSTLKAQRLIGEVRGGLLSKAEYQYFMLLQVRVAEMLGVNISQLEEPAMEAKEYFCHKGDFANAAFAYFVLAKVYEAQENSAKALLYYLAADEWAQKANFQIPNFRYSAIPYNIASWYYRDGKYKESLLYAEKTLRSIDGENEDFHNKLYALELKAYSLQNMLGIDSALRYYNDALQVAEVHKDSIGSNRILFNKCMLLYSSNNLALAEQECKQLLGVCRKTNDSFHSGLLHLALANIYSTSNRVDSALVSIHKAEEVLYGAESHVRLTLYERLYLIEQQAGNHEQAEKYKQLYNRYKAWLNDKQTQERAELGEQAKPQP